MTKQAILFPSVDFDVRSINTLLESEYKAALNFPVFSLFLFDFEEWTKNDRLIIFPKNNTSCNNPIVCVYRGFMQKPDKYASFYERLLKLGLKLINTPSEYAYCHCFPNVYSELKDFTPKIVCAKDIESIDWNYVNSTFKKFMLKDYVKSVKNVKDFPTSFQTPVTPTEMVPVLSAFRTIRGDLFTGGFCFKEFVDLKKYGAYTNEYRAFFLRGKLLSLQRNSSQPEIASYVPKEFVEQFNKLPSRYYTVDFAQVKEGGWIILETGDGQVSGPTYEQDLLQYFRTMAELLAL